MSTIYNKERIHRLFLQTSGDIQAMIRHDNMPKSPRTIKRYAKEGRWYEELSDNTNQNIVTICEDIFSEDSGSNPKALIEKKSEKATINTDSDEIKKLEQVKGVIYKFLVPNSSDKMDELELKPKTYTEAVKCYLDIDSRLDQKKGKSSSSETDAWGEIMRHCASLED
jgi:hypothetical protein